MRHPLVTRARTMLALGLGNVARVASYRLRLRAGVHPVQRIIAPAVPPGPYFRPRSTAAPPAPAHLAQSGRCFGWFEPPAHAAHSWHRNPFTGTEAAAFRQPWWTLPDFDPDVGDIKVIWEPSRLDAVLHDAQRARGGDAAALAALNATLDDWLRGNPAYLGLNWKCGQEASIRLLHLALAALMLDQVRAATPALLALVLLHLERIAPTIAYAVAQDNNHGTSEAAALFVGGSWLEAAGDPRGAPLARAGRRWLVERGARLIGTDGSFSQYSVNYHRLMLDTLSVAERWRMLLGLTPFDAVFTTRAGAATEWLRAMTDPGTGEAPNIGANDGAYLIPLTDAEPRDHRPSVQLASALFLARRAYRGHAASDAMLAWLELPVPDRDSPPLGSHRFDDGGYALLRRARATCVVRYPRYRFRPSHADALHCDLMVDGENLLRDAGTFSYGAEDAVQRYFAGTAGHNTVQFDDHEQMPRLGRFLWGDWSRTLRLDGPRDDSEGTRFAAAYRDYTGALHARTVQLGDDRLTVHDDVSGFTRRAVLRWRLRPGPWRLAGDTCTDGAHALRVTADVPLVRVALVEGWESRLYMQRTSAPVLEVEVASAGRLTSTYRWAR